jgi:hypothetical protein
LQAQEDAGLPAMSPARGFRRAAPDSQVSDH